MGIILVQWPVGTTIHYKNIECRSTPLAQASRNPRDTCVCGMRRSMCTNRAVLTGVHRTVATTIIDGAWVLVANMDWPILSTWGWHRHKPVRWLDDVCSTHTGPCWMGHLTFVSSRLFLYGRYAHARPGFVGCRNCAALAPHLLYVFWPCKRAHYVGRIIASLLLHDRAHKT